MEALLKDYRPEYTLKAKRMQIAKAKFPLIDIHNHFRWIKTKMKNPDEAVRVMDEIGLKAIVNLDGGWRNGKWSNTLINDIEEYDQRYPGKFYTFCNIDFSDIDSLDFKYRVKNHIKEGIKKGMAGIKLHKSLGLRIRDSKGNVVLPDDDRLKVIWDTAAEGNVPVLYHIADPEAFFQPIGPTNEKIEQLAIHPDWSFYGPEFPKRKKLFECQQKMLDQNPHTTYILAHIASNPEDLDYVSELMDTYKNFIVDTGARLGELGRQPYSSRKFLIKYADRIAFGLDSIIEPARYKTWIRFFETDDEFFSFRQPTDSIEARWMVYGVFLPDDVLEKIYYKNAIRVIKRINF